MGTVCFTFMPVLYFSVKFVDVILKTFFICCEIILFHHFFRFSFQDPVPPAVPDAPATAPAKKGNVTFPL